MDLSLLTLPNLSPLGSKSTAKFQPIKTAENVYRRQGIALPLSINIWDSAPTSPEVTEQSLWVPQTEIDIKTALAEGYPISFTATSIRSSGSPTYTATLIGYDIEAQEFIARDGDCYIDLAFDFVLDHYLVGDFWTV